MRIQECSFEIPGSLQQYALKVPKRIYEVLQINTQLVLKEFLSRVFEEGLRRVTRHARNPIKQLSSYYVFM